MSPPPGIPTRSDEPPPEREGPRGVLLVNLGTPDAPTPAAVRRYLREFLSDPRVVELNPWLWALVLRAFVLPMRARRSAEAYAQVWTPEGSPLLVHSRRLAEGLQARLGDAYRVVLAMRYGEPSLAAGLEELQRAGCEQIRVLPLFPQYSNSTTGSVRAEVSRLLAARRAPPACCFAPAFPTAAGYVEAVARRAEETAAGGTIDHWIFSFHGLPEAYVRRGDPYLEHCTATSWKLARRLGLERSQWEMVFQSRFGRQPWLRPALDEYVAELAARAGRVLVLLPAFAADCLETLEEVGVRLRALYLARGGGELLVAPALNDSPAWLDFLEQWLRRGWS